MVRNIFCHCVRRKPRTFQSVSSQMSTFPDNEIGGELANLPEEPKCKLEVKFKTKRLNILEFTLELVPHRYQHQCSERKYVKVGNFDLNVRLDANDDSNYTVLFRLYDRYKSIRDDVIQAITFSSRKGRVKEKTYFCDDTRWRILYEENHSGHLPYKTDLFVQSRILIIKSPLSVLYDDTELTDFELCAQDGSVMFHSTVLAAASPSLRRMLAGRWAETESRKLKLLYTSKTTLLHLKHYLYTDRLPDLGLETVKQLLLLASYHLITNLEHDCTEKIISLMTTENSTEIARFALGNNLMKLYYAYLGMVKDGLIDVRTLQDQELKLGKVVYETNKLQTM